MTIIIGGYIGLLPASGLTWDYLQYLLGLKCLGHDVYYVEDTGAYPNYQLSQDPDWSDASDTINYLSEVMTRFGFAEKWAYRNAVDGKCHGISAENVKKICARADIFINLSAASLPREEYMNIPIKIMVDTDPMFTQVQNWDDKDPDTSYSNAWDAYCVYDKLASFGENIGNADCKVPALNLNWKATRQPICINIWANQNILPANGTFTTIMNWSTRKPMIFQGEEWGQKNAEFAKIKSLPKSTPDSFFSIVVSDNSGTFVKGDLEIEGWSIFSPDERIADLDHYKSFIQTSFGEISIAKQTYVKSHCGWFPPRSACYLASGRPVVLQETGWTKFIPSGDGVISFTESQGAADGIRRIQGDPNKHSKAALEIAYEYFSSDTVLRELIDV